VNTGFYLGVCPERVMPGKLLANLRGLSRVCGGTTPEVAEVMVSLYSQFVQADLDATDVITAELVKTTENAYRDVQIAFANEVALICEANQADVWRVRELVNKSPYRQMHMPGAGVGGHCIPKDPWLLAYSVEGTNTPLRLLQAARQVNDAMPTHVLDLLQRALEAEGLEIAGARVLVLGYAYLENSDDTRNSPSEALVTQLRTLGAHVVVHDPFVSGYGGDVYDLASHTNAIVAMVRHGQYIDMDLDRLRSVVDTPVLIDGRHTFDPDAAHGAGFAFVGVGITGTNRRNTPGHFAGLRL
jgi:UDP-N-acetyl-D-mannosaminuronic acid dehydrogenase